MATHTIYSSGIDPHILFFFSIIPIRQPIVGGFDSHQECHFKLSSVVKNVAARPLKSVQNFPYPSGMKACTFSCRSITSSSLQTKPRCIAASGPRLWQQLPPKLVDSLRKSSLCISGALIGTYLLVTPAFAADTLKTCSCLLKECRLELARCIADPSCAANVACLQTCNDRPDETECQLKCGDVFENKVVDAFNDCAVSKKHCVPRKEDEGLFPVPPASALVPQFNTNDFTGKWYISSGLNPSFDTFDCQLHEFSASPQRLTGNLTWRVSTPDGGFITRTAVQNFVQDSALPGALYNHGNEFLHYQDDWYILSSKIRNKPDDYVFVYYRGSNDAWDGYGGAVVYTRSPRLPQSIVPELKEAASKVGLDFGKFKATDNTCGPEPPLLARIEKKVEEGEKVLEKEVQEIESSVGKAEMSLLDRIGNGIRELERDEQRFVQELNQEEKALLGTLQMEAEDVEKLFGGAIPLRKIR